MSRTNAELLQGVRVVGRFEAAHIGAFGLGEVGPIYLTITPKGRIVKAEAVLIDAPFKRMLIDDPDILRIFGKRGEKITMSVLHPCPRFRLEPVNLETEDLDFDVGRLVDITNQPAAAVYGTSKFNLGMVDPSRRRTGKLAELEEKRDKQAAWMAEALSKADAVAPPFALQSVAQSLQQDSRPIHTDYAVEQPLAPTGDTECRLSSAIDASNPSSAHGARNMGAEPTPPPRQVSPIRTTLPTRRKVKIPKGPIGKKMEDVLQKINANLNAADQATYRHYVLTVRKDTGDDEPKKRSFHEELRAFVDRHGIVELHNEYATYQKSSGSNKRYQLPIFDIDTSMAEGH